MIRTRIAPPAALPVTLEEARAHLRVDGNAEDDYLLHLIGVAVAHVEAVTQKALISQGWRVYLDTLPGDGCVALPVEPVIAIDSVIVHDGVGEPRTLDPSAFRLVRFRDPPRLVLDSAPAPHDSANGAEIDLRAGFGDAGADVPGQIRRAILVLVAHWHAFRGQATDEALYGTVPRGFQALIAPWRPVRI